MKNLCFLLGLVALAAPANDTAADRPTVRWGKLSKSLTFTGELQAVDSVTVGTPNVPSKWNFVISYLAPEGTVVEPGDLLVAFDAADLQLRRLDLEKEREEARLKIAQTKAQQEIQRQDSLLAVAMAEKNLKAARLDAALDPQLIERSKYEQYRYNLEKAQVEHDRAVERLANQDLAAEAEREVVQVSFEKADLELKRLLGELERMSIRAEARGVVLHANSVDGRKPQVGDTVFKGWPLVMIPDMERAKVEASVFDSDIPHLYEGQAAEVLLDALPGRVWPARVARIPDVAKPVDRSSQINVFQVDVRLLESDPQVMKPGMTARVRIPIEGPEGWLVARDAIELDDSGRVFVRTPPPEGRKIEITALDAAADLAVVEGDLTEGLQLERPRESVGSTADDQREWIPVDRQDLQFKVPATGILAAGRSVDISPPPIPRTWQFKIVQMAPEGRSVKAGDPLLAFDPSEVAKRLNDEETALKKVEQEFEKTKASLELKVKDLELELEEARAASEKASGKLAQARQFESSLQIRKAELDAALANRKVEILERKLAATRTGTGLELEIFEDSRNLHRERIQAARRAIEMMSIKAPIDGVVIYTPNWNNEKKQVGSQVQFHETVLSLPDLESLRVEGQVSELDADKVRLGQSVSVTLDALPDRVFSGRIVEIGNVFQKANPQRPLKVLSIVVELDELDVRRMRPDMAARIEVVADRFENALSIPLSVVQVEDGDSFVWVKNGEGIEKRTLRLGRDNGLVAVVESGLKEGDQVLGRP